MNTFIKIVEVWTPTKDRKWLGLSDGIFGNFGAFRAQSEMRSFAYDKGLLGKAWSQRRPIILTDLEHSYFQRKDEASSAGITACIAIPIFAGEYILAVIVLLCGDDEHQAGAVELWAKNKEEKLGLVEGYFPSLGNFAWQSRRVTFSKELGLPGRVWKSRMPEIIADITNPSSFIRADLAADIGISTAVGIPVSYDNDSDYVLTLLSVKETPIAHRYEIWELDPESQSLRFHSGYCDDGEDLTALHASAAIKRGEGFLGTVWLTGCPAVSHNPVLDGLTGNAASSELSAALAMPILENSYLKAIVVFLF